MKIPRWYQCGIFSIRPWWALFLFVGLHGQSGLLPALHKRAAGRTATPIATTDSLTILALRVAFTPDENLSTTGDGTFLMMLTETDSLRCDGFLVDPPPHDAPYFYAQLEAVANYFENVSNGKVTFNRDSCRVFPEGDDPIVLDSTMASYYRPEADEDTNDSLLVKLFAESLVAAAADSDVKVMDYDLVVVFHAGLGQDFAYPTLDPTPRDIPRAYIDRQMISEALGTPGIPLPPDSTLFDRGGILLPEGQNHIYYNIIEDIFFGATDYCDLQIGLTGTFVLLLGYALGFPPLFDTDDGVTGVGVFGLMDVGSNNGLGVIPSPPSAWTRTHLGWEVPIELVGDAALVARHLPEERIGRISLSSDEYFLVENRLNWIRDLPGVSMDSLRYRNRTEIETWGYTLPHYFDYLADSAEVTVDAATGVITSVRNYDIGLPGSGLLIWHVDESRYEDMQGINNDPEARAVALVEADGAVDIGFPTTALFGHPDLGWRWDLWYAGNEAFFEANMDRRVDYPFLSFDSETQPSTHLNSGAESGIAVSRIDSAGEMLAFRVDDGSVTRLPVGSRLLGFNGTKWVYEQGDSLWLGDEPVDRRTSGSSLTVMISEHDAPTGPVDSAFWIIDQLETGYRARRFFLNGDIHRDVVSMVPYLGAYYDEGLLWIITNQIPLPSPPDTINIAYLDPTQVTCCWGYLFNTEDRVPVVRGSLDSTALPDTFITWPHNDRISLGDIDGDGLDEIVAVDSDFPSAASAPVRAYRLTAVNADGTVIDGFPVAGDFQSPALIASLEGDIRPELVVVESGDIAVYSPEGQPIARLGLHAQPDELFLFHIAGDSVGLANGDRIHWFKPKPDQQNPQWVTPQGRHSRSRYSLNDGTHMVDQPAVLDKARVYNYPNPVTGSATTIRFYTGQANRAMIRIYTVDGLSVAQAKLANLAINDYNEWRWEVGDNPSGLYYAVVEVEGAESADRRTALVKIAVVR